MSTEYHGPFENSYPYRITVDGFEVPKVQGKKMEDGTWRFLLDGRFEWDATEAEVQQWMWIVANAMAIGAGYSCFGENSKPLNPFTRRLIGVIFNAAEQSVQSTDGGIPDSGGDPTGTVMQA